MVEHFIHNPKVECLNSTFNARAQRYKDFYVRNLRKFAVFVPSKPFQPNLMFVSNAGAYLSKASFRCCTLG